MVKNLNNNNFFLFFCQLSFSSAKRQLSKVFALEAEEKGKKEKKTKMQITNRQKKNKNLQTVQKGNFVPIFCQLWRKKVVILATLNL